MSTGKKWTLKDGSQLVYRATPNRPATLLVRLDLKTGSNPKLEVSFAKRNKKIIPLSRDFSGFSVDGDVKRLPITSRTWFAQVPAELMKRGVGFRVIADQVLPSAYQIPAFSLPSSLTIQTIPFYLFGATPNLVSYADAISPNAAKKDELLHKWPISELNIQAHPMEKIEWDYLVVPPKDGKTAEVIRVAGDSRMINTILGILTNIFYAGGDAGLSTQYYGSIIQADAAGKYRYTGGGVGWGHVSVGDHYYSGIFNHETGHAFELGHAAGEYRDGKYPYEGGSLKGSVWGFDSKTNTFISDLVSSDAQNYAKCKDYVSHGYARPLDSLGNCYKVDVMESGGEDRSAKYAYGLFSDFNAARIQRYMEKRAIASTSSKTGYAKWNQALYQWVDYDPTDDTWDRARFGIHRNYAQQRHVQVSTVVFSISNAGTENTTQIYPLSQVYQGNLLRLIDPIDANDLAKISRNNGSIYQNFCVESGCDYTLKVYYSDDSVKHIAVQGGFRPWFKESGDFSADALDATKSASFKTFAINIPADQPIRKVELLHTPVVWRDGVSADATVLATRDN
jgi:hypothetical protein